MRQAVTTVQITSLMTGEMVPLRRDAIPGR